MFLGAVAQIFGAGKLDTEGNNLTTTSRDPDKRCSFDPGLGGGAGNGRGVVGVAVNLADKDQPTEDPSWAHLLPKGVKPEGVWGVGEEMYPSKVATMGVPVDELGMASLEGR